MKKVCGIPPPGWWCSRKPGHEGPCAARQVRDIGALDCHAAYPLKHWFELINQQTLALFGEIGGMGNPISARARLVNIYEIVSDGIGSIDRKKEKQRGGVDE